MIAFDLETSGKLPEYALQPWRSAEVAWITAASFADEDGRVGGRLRPSPLDLALFLRAAIVSRQVICGWNLTFDIAWLLAYGLDELVFQCRWLDGMRVWRHAWIEPEYGKSRDSKQHYSLKPDAVGVVCPELAGYEDGVDFNATDETSAAALLLYNKTDCQVTLRCVRHFWNLLSPARQRCVLIESACLPFVAQANLNGMRIDLPALETVSDALAARGAELEESLRADGVTPQMIRSSKQLSAKLFDDWGLAPIKGRSTDKEVLRELPDPRAQRIREWRETLNLRSKFLKSIRAACAYNGAGDVVHPEAIVFGTYSGRMTYAASQGKNKNRHQTGFPLHQMKRGPLLRSLVVPPDGYSLIELDAAGQEFKWMAILSGDAAMLDLCRPGEDPHSYMAAAIAGMDYREVQRRAQDKTDIEISGPHGLRMFGKLANLASQYRTSARKLCSVARVDYDIPMTIEQAQHVWQTYRRVYPGVPEYWARAIALAKAAGYAETLAHRRVQLRGNWDGSGGYSLEQTALNYPIQGTGADQKYLALSVLAPYLREHGISLAWDLHDGLYFYAPSEKAQELALMMKAILDHLPYGKAWGFEPPVPLSWDVKVGDSWGSLKAVA